MKHLFFLVLIVMPIFVSKAQIGINTLTPHNTSALHIESGGTKGLLIPMVNNQLRNSLGVPSSQLPKGLFVCDTVDFLNPVFYSFDTKFKRWLLVNPLYSIEDKDNINSRSILKLSSSGGTVTFADNVTVNGITTIDNSMTINKGLTINGNSGLTVNGNIVARNDSIKVATIDATKGNATVHTKTVVATTVNATTVNATNGNGITPLGGIIMWSGNLSDIPDDWALCDGTTKNGRTTPNLSGRFIVGAGAHYASDERETLTANYEVGNTGGRGMYVLSPDEMPKHTHNTSFRSKSNPGDQNQSGLGHSGGGGDVITPTLESGKNESHENRPPYYVLAFIMRVQ